MKKLLSTVFFSLCLLTCLHSLSFAQTKDTTKLLTGAKEEQKIKVMVETDTTINSVVSKTHDGKIIGTLLGVVGGYALGYYLAAGQQGGLVSFPPGFVGIVDGVGFGLMGCIVGGIIDSKQNKPFLIFSGTNNGKAQAITIRETRTVFYTLKEDALLHKGEFKIKDREHFTLKGQENIPIGINNLDKINSKSTLYRNIFVPLFLAIVPMSVYALTKNHKSDFDNSIIDYPNILMSSPFVGIAIGYGIGNYFDRQRTFKNMIRVAYIKNN